MYGADSDDRSRIDALVQQTPSRPKRLSYALPGPSERHVALEEKAAEISVYSAILVPALLQTPEYAAAAIKANPMSSIQIEKVRIESRLIRQAILARQTGPRLNIVIDEAVLRRTIGDASIMRRQMLRLIELSERPATSIRVLPFSVGAHPAQTGHFAILYFEEDEPPQVYCDDLTGGTLHSKPEHVHFYRLCFQAITEIALDAQESVQMFIAVAEEDRARSSDYRSQEPV